MIRSPRRSAGRSRLARLPIGLAALVTAGGVLLAGCAAGQQAQTAEQRASIDGVDAEVGSMAIRNVALEYPTAGLYRKGGTARLRMVLVNTGNAADTLVEVRTDAADSVSFVSGAEASPSAAAGSATPSESASASATPSESASPSATPSGSASASGSASPSAAATSAEPSPSATGEPGPTGIAIGPNTFVGVGEGAAGTGIELTGLTTDLRPSQVISVTFMFRTAGSVTVPVAVGIPADEVSPAPTIEGGEEG